MKQVDVYQGQAFIRFRPEEVLPKGGTPAAEIADRLAKDFSFKAVPQMQIPPQLAGLPIMTFGVGQISLNENQIGVTALGILNEMIAVACKSTDFADEALDHILALLDRGFGFRFGAAKNIRRDHISTVVVTFDDRMTNFFNSLGSMGQMIGKHRAKNDVFPGPFEFFRIGFGRDIGPVMPVTEVDNLGFSIERRAGVPFDQNVYFCSAPMTTKTHIAALEEIEASIK